MTITVEAPGGIEVEFPDDTPPDVMQAAMRKRFLMNGPPQTQSLPQFDAMGNPTGATTDVPVAPQMPYGQQMANVARGTGDVAKVLANGMTLGLADQGVAALRAATGDAPSYTNAIKQEQAATDAIGAATPGVNTALKVGGGLLAAPIVGAVGLGGRAMQAGMGFLPRVAGFAADAAGLGAVGGAAAVNTGNPMDYVKGAGTGAASGATLGAGLPVAGQIAGSVYRSALPFFSRPVAGAGRAATGLLTTAIPADAATTLADLGPAGLLADVGPGTQGLAQGVAARGNEGAGLLATLRARQEAAPTRLNADLETNLGPAISPVDLNAAMDARIAAAAPAQTAAVANAPPVAPTNALAEIGNRLANEPAGPMRNSLLRVREMLAPEVNGVPAPVTDARTLLRARQNIDNMIEYGDPLAGLAPGAARGEGGPLLAVRRELNTALHNNIPALRNADQAIHAANLGRDAIEVGRKALGGGQEAIWPANLATEFNASPLERQALMRAGNAADIRTRVGTNPNDLSAFRKLLGDTQDFNRAKATTLQGPDAVAGLQAAIDRESIFANTANPAIAGSRTAPMTENSRAIDAASEPYRTIIPTNVTPLGLLGHSMEWATRRGLGLLGEARGENVRAQLGQILSMPPSPQRDAILQSLLAAQANQATAGQGIRNVLSNPALPIGLLEARRSGGNAARR